MLAATSVQESRAPGRSATGSDSSKFCYPRNRGAQAVLRSSDRGEPPRPGPGRRSGLGVSRRSPHPFRTHREPLPPGPRDAPPRDRRGHARRDAGGLGEPGVLSARARGGRAAAQRRLHALHDGDLSGARRADRLDPLLHRPGQARLSLRLRARPGQRTHRRRRGAALPAPRGSVRALRVRARVRAKGPLPRPSAPPVLRVELPMIAPALDLERLRGLPEDALDDTLRSFADAHGAEALPVLGALAAGAERAMRRAAKRALYRLAQRGVTAPARPAPRPVVERAPERAARAWVSGCGRSGSRALRLPFAGRFRLAAPDQVEAEREDAIVGRVIERELGPEARRRWARRLAEMALVFDATGRADLGALARAAAAALGDPDVDPRRHPFARALAQRALELAAEVASGRLRASDVSRKVHPVE